MDNIPLQWNDKNNKNNQEHHFLLPSPNCRALIVGESGCGKTNLLLRMLLMNKWLDYNNLFVFGKSLHQSEYKLLKSGFEKGYNKDEILNFLNNEKNENIDSFLRELKVKCKNKKCNVCYYEDANFIPDPKDVSDKKKNLFIFDDIMTDSNQSKAEDFYTRGRHNNISSIYISQNYFRLPRQTIRSNANVLILFSLPEKDIRHIFNDFISNDMKWDEFKEFCNKVWRKSYCYIIINKTLPPDKGKYQANFNLIYIPKIYIPNKFFSLK